MSGSKFYRVYRVRYGSKYSEVLRKDELWMAVVSVDTPDEAASFSLQEATDVVDDLRSTTRGYTYQVR